MTQEEVIAKMQEGLEGLAEVKPKVEMMTSLMMECYEEGFKTCWKIITGTDFCPK